MKRNSIIKTCVMLIFGFIFMFNIGHSPAIAIFSIIGCMFTLGIRD